MSTNTKRRRELKELHDEEVKDGQEVQQAITA